MPTKEEHYDAGDKLREAGQMPQAVEAYQAALALDPAYALAHSALAVTFGKLGQHEQAIQHALRVCELEPNEVFSFTALSVTYVRAGRIPEAEYAKAKAHELQHRGH